MYWYEKVICEDVGDEGAPVVSHPSPRPWADHEDHASINWYNICDVERQVCTQCAMSSDYHYAGMSDYNCTISQFASSFQMMCF